MNENDEKIIGAKEGDKIKAESESYRRFLAVAEKYMMLRICALVSLVAFVFGVLIFGHSSLKSENFKYLVKYIDKSPVLYSSFYEGIEYAGGENAKFGLYKGDVCVFDEGLLSLYGISGKNTLRSETGIGNAAVAIGKEHLCVYGGSSNELCIYNSFSMVHSEKFDYPVLLVSPADDGGYAVATSERGYRSVVYVYNKAFIHKYTWKSADRYIFDMDISASGRYLAVISMGVKNGSPFAEASYIDTEKGSVIFTRETEGDIPVGVNITEKGGVCFVFERSALYCDKKGNVKKEERITGSVYSVADGSKYTAVMSRNEGSIKSEVFLPESGIKISAGGKINSVKFYGDRIYLLLGDRVEIYEEGTLIKSAEISSGARDILIMNDGAVIVCFGSYTTLISDIT